MNRDQIDRLVDIHIEALEILQGGDPRATDGEIQPSLTHYRDDGFSVEVTENGGRSHRLVDEVLADLRAYGRNDIADAANQFFVFPPDLHPELWPTDERAQKAAQSAFDLNWGEWTLMPKRTPWFAPFRKALANPDRARNRNHEIIDGHAAVFLPKVYQGFMAGYEQMTAHDAMNYLATNLRRYLDD